MDGELTAIPSSTVKAQRGEGDTSPKAPTSSRETFEKVFPVYLAMGMTYEDFYKKDHTLVIAYREAFKLQRIRNNQEQWQLGLYVYQAVSRVAPLLIPFNKNPKPEPYLDKPIPFYESENETQNEAVYNKGLAYMQAKMIEINKKFGK